MTPGSEIFESFLVQTGNGKSQKGFEKETDKNVDNRIQYVGQIEEKENS